MMWVKSVAYNRRKVAGALFATSLLTLAMLMNGVSNVQAAAGINKQVNFQGKVVNANGTNVANGSYTFVFNIYTQQAPGGTSVWTE